MDRREIKCVNTIGGDWTRSLIGALNVEKRRQSVGRKNHLEVKNHEG